jgi:DNA helicase HerA-like ATPase
MVGQYLIGGNGQQNVHLNLRMANRHGLIAGATGTGKTVSLQVLAEGFAKAGVPVFLADIKGDLSGLAKAGKPHAKVEERVKLMNISDYQQRLFPCVFWDLYANKGHSVRATISDFGPLLLANFFDLNETQTGVLYAAFKIADDQGMLMLDLKDLQAMLNWMKDERKSLEDKYGGISEASVAAIQRRLMMLEQEGADKFFGEPALDLNHLMQVTLEGTGVVNILDATTLVNQPKLYAIFLLWLISELFENLPEQGDADKPKLVFFFDEAHLLFNGAPKLLVDKIEQVVRLIRSKGVGIYFISQSPADIPDSVLGQLGNRIQHALRAYTPKDQQAVKIAAQTFRPNPAFSTATVITELGIGEALVSVLDEKGSPTPVERVMVAPPASRIGPLSDDERAEVMGRSPYKSIYDQINDRESAYEILKNRVEQQTQSAQQQKIQEQLRVEQERIFKEQQREQQRAQQKEQARQQKEQAKAQKPAARSSSRRDTAIDALAKSTARAIGSNLGRQIVRGILGSLLGGKK